MKMKNRKAIALTLFGFAAIALFVNAFLPSDAVGDFFETTVVNNVEYRSELTEINKKDYGIHAFLTYDTDGESFMPDTVDHEKNQFVIMITQNEGILKNKKSFSSYSVERNDFVLNPKYENIESIPSDEVKKGSKYYGSVYYGIAPLDCEKVTINGHEAELHRMTFDLNGQEADFYLYYCIVKENTYPENPELICTTQEGKQFRIESVELGQGEHSKVIPLN